jgi:hypothetical protein
MSKEKPTVEQLARLAVGVQLLDGKVFPVEPIEEILRSDKSLRIAWERRWRETNDILTGAHPANSN